MIDRADQTKIELIRFHLSEQIQNLRTMTQVDLQLFSGYLTLQIALGGWLVRQSGTSSTPTGVRIGMSLVDLALTVVAGWLLRNSHLRRKEVIQTVRNCNEALGFEELSVYIEGRVINAETKTRLWYPLYLFGIITAAAGIQLILFAA